MTFSDIESKISDDLPPSAYKYREFWSNSRLHSVAFGWLDAGFKTTRVDFEDKKVYFERD